MSQLLVTKLFQTVVSAFYEADQGITQFHIVPEDESSVRMGDIYLGQVQNVVKNISAAFVEIAPGVNGYLPLNESGYAIYANPKNNDKVCVGDKILVQVAKEPVKTKPVSLTTDFSLSGKFIVLLPFHAGTRLSSKITDAEERMRLQSIGERILADTGHGCIIRTNAVGHTEQEIEAAMFHLLEQYRIILQKGPHSIRHARLYTGIPAYLADLRDAGEQSLTKIQTDDAALYDEIREFLLESQPEDIDKLILYQDEQISLSALYRIQTSLEHALSERVWMKSGAYLVIQPTEALTVIDVNSGKAIKGKKSTEELAFAINMEAAKRIGTELKLRNLSGMILIDFINMKSKESIQTLLDFLEQELKKDATKTTLVDMTGLGLVEITRKRTSRPLHEYFQRKGDMVDVRD